MNALTVKNSWGKIILQSDIWLETAQEGNPLKLMMRVNYIKRIGT